MTTRPKLVTITNARLDVMNGTHLMSTNDLRNVLAAQANVWTEMVVTFIDQADAPEFFDPEVEEANHHR